MYDWTGYVNFGFKLILKLICVVTLLLHMNQVYTELWFKTEFNT